MPLRSLPLKWRSKSVEHEAGIESDLVLPLFGHAIHLGYAGQIASLKVPQYFMIVESLPRTVTGKIRKHVLKESAIGELGLSEAARIKTA